MNQMLYFSALLCAAVSLHARADCLDDAARYHRVSIQVVRAIAQQESGMRPYVTSRNTDGSEDIGLMQVNRNLRGCYNSIRASDTVSDVVVFAWRTAISIRAVIGMAPLVMRGRQG
ncbi:transglycosylase SLT domain-containing protein [Caballeronia humi]|uniref:Lytic transglycosylase catalytic n=1 Tax=Caballeronia humi TaxID=326474 RepID=A0A158JBU4_9BURK|nr:transglycosylase SLT domain-containing protein [Caballeronia humi]SAL66324.1 lytic transglycosylase catalytic [Caballeronia humi]